MIESMGDFIKVHTKDRKIMPRCSLSMIEKTLPSERFLRIHNSYIVSIDHIIAFTASSVEIGDTEIPISRKYKNVVMKILEGK
jgi:DNA-binding LytR/AlgR family response regulator